MLILNPLRITRLTGRWNECSAQSAASRTPTGPITAGDAVRLSFFETTGVETIVTVHWITGRPFSASYSHCSSARWFSSHSLSLSVSRGAFHGDSLGDSPGGFLGYPGLSWGLSCWSYSCSWRSSHSGDDGAQGRLNSAIRLKNI